jgi:hypothetical protein
MQRCAEGFNSGVQGLSESPALLLSKSPKPYVFQSFVIPLSHFLTRRVWYFFLIFKDFTVFKQTLQDHPVYFDCPDLLVMVCEDRELWVAVSGSNSPTNLALCTPPLVSPVISREAPRQAT